MELSFLGATGTVTGSKYLLTRDSGSILIDCGLFQGLKQLRLKNWERLPFALKKLNAVVLTHAHIDHSGHLPILVRNGYRGAIYCTDGTRDLCEILLPDCGYLQEEEARYANRQGYSRHHPALPLYTEKDARRALEYLKPVGYDTEIELEKGITVRFLPAGHILGASMVYLTIDGTSILFSGDLGRPNDMLMKPPAVVNGADYLVLESTYGDRLHSRTDPADALEQIVNRTADRNGTLVVPAFAVGRAQTLMYLLHQLKREKRIPSIPIYLNSPMAINATDIFRRHSVEHRLSEKECAQVFDDIHLVHSVEESKALNRRRDPIIIISASGMITGGRVLHHIEAFGPDPRNTILLTGFQGAGTRGSDLASGAGTVKMHGVHVPIRAEIVVLENLSAHADCSEILQWLGNFTSAPRQTYLTHGEPVASDALRRRIQEELGWSVMVPEYRQRVSIESIARDTARIADLATQT